MEEFRVKENKNEVTNIETTEVVSSRETINEECLELTIDYKPSIIAGLISFIVLIAFVLGYNLSRD